MAVRGDRLGLEKKFEACIDELARCITDKINSFQNAVSQRLDEQVPQFRGLAPTSSNEFEVRSSMHG